MEINNSLILQMRKFISRDTEMLLLRQLISGNQMKTPVSLFSVHRVCFSPAAHPANSKSKVALLCQVAPYN